MLFYFMKGVDYIYYGNLKNYGQMNLSSNESSSPGLYLFKGVNGDKSYFKVIGYEEDCVSVQQVMDSKLIGLLFPKAEKKEKEMAELELAYF